MRSILCVVLLILLCCLPAAAGQHDFDITTADANTGLTFRQAVNAALQALATNSSGSTAPSNPYPYMFWADTTANKLKMRNGGNTTWIDIGDLDLNNLGMLYASGTNVFTVDQKLKGAAKIWRFIDTSVGGNEWGIRSSGSKFEILENTATSNPEDYPAWTVRGSFSATATTTTGDFSASGNTITFGDGAAGNKRILANNADTNKPEISFNDTAKAWQLTNDGTTFYGMSHGIAQFTSSGTFTVPQGVTAVEVVLVGGGGGGGSGTGNGIYGSGGGAGQVFMKYISGLTPGSTVSVTVGAGGAGGTNTSGSAGGASSFGAYASAKGGIAGVVDAGNASTKDGGTNIYGNGGTGNGGGGGAAGGTYGGGGGGSLYTWTGGSGGAGMVLVRW